MRKEIFLCMGLLFAASMLCNYVYMKYTLMSAFSECESTKYQNPDRYIHAGETERLKNASDALPWLSHPRLPRRLSRRERDRYIELLSTVDAILREFNVTYTLARGTLLGSFVMHDILPWDDDLDLFVSIGDLPKMKRLFNASGAGHYKQIKLFESRRRKAFTIKLFRMRDPSAGGQAWNWPFIDIAFYLTDNNRVRSHDDKPEWWIKRADFFPLTLRPLAGRWFPAPRNTAALIRKQYKHFVCKKEAWDHKYELGVGKVQMADCRQLTSHYPFVERKVVLGETIETLMLNGTALYSLTLEE